MQSGDLGFIRGHARELPPIRLPDALQLCLLIRDRDPERYERAALRWLGRFALEARGATLEELQVAADAFEHLPQQPQEAMDELSALCVRHRLGG